MTISIDIGTFNAKLTHNGGIGKRSREVELKVMWHSCGVYDISYYRPRDAKPHYVLVEKDWYPPDTHVNITPEQFDKTWELFPTAPRRPRPECYKPFYEDYMTSIGMFDMGDDWLFQAYRDPYPEADKVYLVTHQFNHGAPDTGTSVLGLEMADFQKLKDLIEKQKGEIFYSGCKISMPSVNVTAMQEAVAKIDQSSA